MSVHALSFSAQHNFSKQSSNTLTLLPDLGVKGDCHCGETVQHRSRLKIRPPPKNLRQVHLIDLEILDELKVKPGELGENITTKGVKLLELGAGTRLHLMSPAATATGTGTTGSDLKDGGPGAGIVQERSETAGHPVLVVTGLRNPCPQINHFRSGLQERFVERDEQRAIVVRKAGIMSTVEVGGAIEVGMRIVVEQPAVWKALECV
ncbi:hypothetical protein A1O7_00593 [Cladophialophora yegresii CBS 114405]|uniref:MOSC domain-containing protein n=1 Tax=Cladophialophora yegresii CBS 114405 TaxID=1182544 RepID=W9W834_9EURO|nr:uncharacterized protein A1O7_00593 [Cladophialophora yegresii CBS 114405]EXJ64257.1 hypothetical protein A1O7_00593 [Cladophialophora yegresii CBS 114405]